MSKSGVSSSDLAVEYDDEREVKNDGRVGRCHSSDDSTRRTGSTELTSVETLAQKGKKNTQSSHLASLDLSEHAVNPKRPKPS
jgi:hypothetical protein